MKKLYDLIQLSQIYFPIQQEGWFKCKILRFIQYLKNVSDNYKANNLPFFKTVLNTHLSVNISHLPFSAICMFTVFELLVLVVMSVIHENHQKKWFIIPSLISLTITHFFCLIKYILLVDQPIIDGIEMCECLFIGLAIIMYMIFTSRFQLKHTLLCIFLNNVYQISYALTDSKFFKYLPILVFCFQIGTKSKNLYVKVLCSVMFINHIAFWLNDLLFFDYTAMYHLVNIPCLFLIWYSLLLPNDKSTRLVKQE